MKDTLNKFKVDLKHLLMNRKALIEFIKSKDSFYLDTSFEGHSMEELEKIYFKIKREIVLEKIKKLIYPGNNRMDGG